MPWMRIGNFPTPVEECPALAERIGAGRVFIKRDDLTSRLYGGNKVRKLEFVLADAERRKYSRLLTIGGIGSNHLLATTIHGGERGFKTIGCVTPQPVTPHVKKNLLLYKHFGTELHLASGDSAVPGLAIEVIARNAMRGRAVYFVAVGGSSPLGAIGYVEAAYELLRQVEAGVLPEPDYIFTASGSGGTAAGLSVGCRAANMKTRVVATQVADLASSLVVSQLATLCSAKLRMADSKFPFMLLLPSDIDHRSQFFGERYGAHTREGEEAIEIMKETAGLKLEGVYTGKAASAMIAAGRSGELAGKTVVYWHTFNSVDLSDLAAKHSYKELPRRFHKFFETPEHELG